MMKRLAWWAQPRPTAERKVDVMGIRYGTILRAVLLAAVAAGAAPAVAAEKTAPAKRAARPRRPSPWSRGLIPVGQTAPDFELAVLTEGKDAKGNKVNRITDKKVKLSSFRGKKLVCVFISSYT